MGTAGEREARRRRVGEQATEQAGVLSRRQLYAAGLTRWEVAAEVRARRWQRSGRQCVVITPGRWSQEAAWWAAVLEVGPRAALDGGTALLAAGLRGITVEGIHVAAPKSSRPLRARGVVLHETRRYRSEDVMTSGLPRVRPPVAAVHAALWAQSDRQAALFLAAPVQQRIVAGADLLLALADVRRHPRRKLLQAVAADVVDGAESMGELDFARWCRRRGLPKPDRQVVRRLPSGRVYLDVHWRKYRLTVEIDGAGHLDVVAATGDALKQNAEQLGEHRVLRIPVLALRVDPGPFLDQVDKALRLGGWQG